MSQWDLRALETFSAVVQAGGVGKAARALGRPKATLSRQIRELEQSLGVRLFERGARDLRPTAEGRLLHERTRAALHDLGEARQLLLDGSARPRGPLRVSAPVLLSNLFLGRLAADFTARHPEVRLEIAAEDRPVDLVEEGYDVAIRVNPDPAADLVGRLFARDELLVVAPAGWRRPPADDAEPHRVPAVVNTATAPAAVWRCVGPEGELLVEAEPRLRLSSLLMVRDAVLAGAGVAQLPLSLVHGDLASGRLQSWGQAPDRTVELWALHHSRRLASLKIAAFIDFICDAFPDRTLTAAEGLEKA
ncbi:LysR family transcriptional regulator [Phenylobacterium terrae]|uniref:LysR family transcriptional regulator n=1 Tax=Phenylobacterium terrae TaxID=2665495 RepID=A0ABW4MXM3_9CAUL